MMEQQAFKNDGEVVDALGFRAFPRYRMEAAPKQPSPLEFRAWGEHRVLTDALQRHLTFLDTVMDRLAASQGTNRAENDVDTEAETVAGLLVRLSRMNGSTIAPTLHEFGEEGPSHD